MKIHFISLPLFKKNSSEPKLYSMQFLIIHQITNGRYNLNQWKITSNDKCQFCNSYMADNVTLALGECEPSRQIISNIFKELDPERNILHNISVIKD